jgi:hypothetical protein
MEVLYIEDLASYGGPESCVGVPRGRSEALTGVVRAGLLSREIEMQFGVPTFSRKRKAISAAALARAVGGPRAVEEPGHARKLHAREPGDPTVVRGRLIMPRPGWFAGWQIGAWRSARGTQSR